MKYGLADVKVGDELILTSRYEGQRTDRVTVSRVGRKYVYVSRPNGRELRERFSVETGVEDHQYGSPDELFTPEQWEDRGERNRLFQSLKAHGLGQDFASRQNLSTDKLRRLVAVLENPEEG